MPIKVNISLSSGGRFKPVSSHTLHDKRITVGRDKDCTLTLEDTQKHVSRMHVELEEADGSYWLKVVSKVNPVIVNGKRYNYENRVPLTDGDQITVGLYKLEVAEIAAPAPARVEPPKRAAEKAEDITYVARPGTFPGALTRTPTPPAEAAETEEATYVPPPRSATPPSPEAIIPALDVTPPSQVDQAEEATFVPPVKTQKPAPSVPAAEVKPQPSQSVPLDIEGADDEVTYIKPMAARPPRPPATPAEGSAQAEEPFSEDMTHIRRPVVKPPLAATPVKPPQPPLGLDLDLSDAFGSSHETSPPKRPPEVPSLPEVEEGFSDDVTYVRRPGPLPTAKPVPPEPAAARGPAADKAPAPPANAEAVLIEKDATFHRPALAGSAFRPPQTTPTPGDGGAPGDRSLQAFLEGAGLAHLQVRDPEKFMRESGAMVRAAVENVMVLLMARDGARTQLRAKPEASDADNPLQSMASAAEALAFLFDPKRPAIKNVDPVKAFADACQDLQAHQAALFAGIQAAVTATLESLDPKKIEREHGVTVGGLNLTRKSKLWDVSVARYESLVRDAAQDATTTLSREILAAYLAQAEKVRSLP